MQSRARRKPTSIALGVEMVKELKAIAQERGIPYQVLMRLLIADGIRRMVWSPSHGDTD